jgi:hypothetical protein
MRLSTKGSLTAQIGQADGKEEPTPSYKMRPAQFLRDCVPVEIMQVLAGIIAVAITGVV